MVHKILFLAAECAPWAKVGGLGDVVGSLPKALAQAGTQVAVMMPRYGFIETAPLKQTSLHAAVPFRGRYEFVSLWQGTLPGSSVPVYFVENATYFAHRTQVYPAGWFELEAEGFLLLCQTVFPLLKALDWRPEILHCHDWHTAPAAYQLRHHADPWFAPIRSVLSIHNAAYQGEFEGTNWLRAGLGAANQVATVSPTYAQELLTTEGCGLQDLLNIRGDLTGILNGIDTDVLNPATDPALVQPYRTPEGKAANKAALQARVGLPINPTVPLIGVVSRLVEQKGFDLLFPQLERLLARTAQWVILGSGDAGYEATLQAGFEQYPNLKGLVGFDATLAQQIYAASDLFLMPSRFEPCGLGQLMALRYGSVPLVRATGGLADTVIDVREHPDTGTGFAFADYTTDALLRTLDAALATYKSPHWQALATRAMAQDFSWGKSAQTYLQYYR